LKTIKVDGKTIVYRDGGEGPAVILAHCSSGSHREWNFLFEALSPRYRVLAPDLIGYGKSDPWPAGRPLDPQEEVNVILQLAELAGGPVRLAGHSYGAAVLLEASRLLGSRVKSLTLVEPVAFHLLRLAGWTAEWNEISSVGHRIIGELARGRPDRSGAAYMGFWVGRLRWWLMPRKARRTILKSIDKVAAEFAMLETFPTTLSDYEAITVPTRLIVGERTRKPARAVTEILISLLSRSHLRTIPGAGHMSPFTHRDAVQRLMVEHITESETSEESERAENHPGPTASEQAA
jgi:pimeloyl-ACP methyl ester carboxylesterase